jgi:hypothetical protein
MSLTSEIIGKAHKAEPSAKRGIDNVLEVPQNLLSTGSQGLIIPTKLLTLS